MKIPPIIPRADLATASLGPAMLSDQPPVPPPQGRKQRQAREVHPEVKAMQQIANLLARFEPEERQRIVAWVAAAYAKAKPIEAP